MSHCSSWSLLALAALCCSLRPSSVILHAGRRTATPPPHNLVHVLPTDPFDLVLKLKPARVFAARRRRALSHRSTLTCQCTPATGLSTVCTSKQRGYRPARVPLQHTVDGLARTRGRPVDLVLQRRLSSRSPPSRGASSARWWRPCLPELANGVAHEGNSRSGVADSTSLREPR
jgi:hypothetical protein